MIKIGILGAAGYTGGELIRLLLNHPSAEIVFANSESNAGNLVSEVHEGLLGETDLRFTSALPFADVDVVFFCFGHGKSAAFLQQHPELLNLGKASEAFQQQHPALLNLGKASEAFLQQHPELLNLGKASEAFQQEHPALFTPCAESAGTPRPNAPKIIDLAQDFRLAGTESPFSATQSQVSPSLPFSATQSQVSPSESPFSAIPSPSSHDFVYGLPETHREAIRACHHLANPGCFATAIQLALLPALKSGLISGDIHVNGITGSTGAGQKPGATTHYSWRNDNISVYKTFTHQHLQEINQTVQELHPGYDGRVLFIPQRGCFARGIFVTAYAKCDTPLEEVLNIYKEYYRDAAFTHVVTKSPDLKQVVNTNKAVVYVEKHEDQLLMISCIDNLLKGAVGQAVQNMNLMFGLDEKAGLNLKASAF